MTVLQGDIIEKQWVVGKRIGSGSYATVHRATDILTKKNVAIKIEYPDVKSPKLEREYHVHKHLYCDKKRVEGVPAPYYYGTKKGQGVLVMDLLDVSLGALLRANGPFPIESVLAIGVVALRRIEYLHSHNILHRDIQPDNFMIDGSKSELYLIDYGLSEHFRCGSKNEHIHWAQKKRFVGTLLFASTWTHHGIEQSRRDDLESLGFMLVYLFRGSLPWASLRGQDEKKLNKVIGELKTNGRAAELCGEMPGAVRSYFRYVRRMRFRDKPDYGYLRGLLRAAREEIEGMDVDKLSDTAN